MVERGEELFRPSKEQKKFIFMSDVLKKMLTEEIVQKHFNEEEKKHAENALAKLYGTEKMSGKERELLEEEKKALIGICNLYSESKEKTYKNFADEVLNHPKLKESFWISLFKFRKRK